MTARERTSSCIGLRPLESETRRVFHLATGTRRSVSPGRRVAATDGEDANGGGGDDVGGGGVASADEREQKVRTPARRDRPFLILRST